jgi:hypothetical protein
MPDVNGDKTVATTLIVNVVVGKKKRCFLKKKFFV